jgi:hypothetical protein
MAIGKFNSAGGYSVNIPPIEIIDESGNITAFNITATTAISSPKFVGTLYGNVIGSSSTLAAATIAGVAPLNPASGTLWWDSSTNALMVFHPLTDQWEPATPPAVQKQFRYSFTDSLVWVVVHNKNTTQFSETLTDSEGDRFIAKINIIDSNSFEVNLTSSTSGVVDVTFG